MKHLRLEHISDKFFPDAWKLYEHAFPLEERRSKDEQIRVLKNSNYHCDVLTEKEQFIGLFFWWEFDTTRYIEYFATSEQHRNKGNGKLILEEFIVKNDKPIVLETELPYSSINRRRIKFYERIGFQLNPHYYELPSMCEGQPPIQFLIMSYPNMLSVEDFEKFRKCTSKLF